MAKTKCTAADEEADGDREAKRSAVVQKKRGRESSVKKAKGKSCSSSQSPKPKKGKTIVQEPEVESESDFEDVPEYDADGYEIGITGEPKKNCTVAVKRRWAAQLEKKNITCERLVKKDEFDRDHRVIEVLTRRTLTCFFEGGKGCIPTLVREFYAELETVPGEFTLRTTVEGHTFDVTPDTIADHLGYDRPIPSAVEYPSADFVEKTGEQYAAIMCIDPSQYQYRGGRFSQGNLKPDYAIMNKIMHTNVWPRGSEGAPSISEMVMLHELMEQTVIDIALVMWKLMWEFVTKHHRSNMPYGELVTGLCKDQGIRIPKARLMPEGAISGKRSTRAGASTQSQKTGGVKSKGKAPASTSASTPADTPVAVTTTSAPASSAEPSTGESPLPPGVQIAILAYLEGLYRHFQLPTPPEAQGITSTGLLRDLRLEVPYGDTPTETAQAPSGGTSAGPSEMPAPVTDRSPVKKEIKKEGSSIDI